MRQNTDRRKRNTRRGSQTTVFFVFFLFFFFFVFFFAFCLTSGFRRQNELRQQDEERTAKLRAKRRKKKEAKQKKRKVGDKGDAEAQGEAGQAGLKKQNTGDEEGAKEGSQRGEVRGAAAISSVSDSRSNASASTKPSVLRKGSAVAAPLSMGAVALRWLTLEDGHKSETPAQAVNTSVLMVLAEGYVSHGVRDTGGDFRDALLNKPGDYFAFTRDLPSRLEAVARSVVCELSISGGSGAASQFASGHAASHEGAFFLGSASLAPAGTLRKKFPAQVAWSTVRSGESGRGLVAQAGNTCIVLIRGKLNVTCAKESVTLMSPGDYVVCPPYQDASWIGLAPESACLGILFPKTL
jgi:hypothetical protein